jgi:Fe-S cluster assembly protein SufD
MSAVADSKNTIALTQCGPDFANHSADFRAIQQSAWERFNDLPMPRRSDENWRFTDVRALTLAPFVRASTVDAALRKELAARSRGLATGAGVMAFANDQLIAQETKSEALKAAGVVWLPFEQAAREYPELLARYFMREKSALGSEKFAALHTSQVKAGMVVIVPKGVEIAAPIEVFHWLSGQNSSVFPHTLIVAEGHAKVTVVDHFYSADDAAGLAVGVNDIFAGPGAKVNYIAIQNWNNATTAFHLNATTVARDAESLALRLNLGGAFIRDEATSRLRAHCKFTKHQMRRAICSTRMRSTTRHARFSPA